MAGELAFANVSRLAIHLQGKIGVEANRLENSLAGDVLAVWIPANGRVIAVDGEMLLPIFGSGIYHGIFLFNKEMLATVPVSAMEVDDHTSTVETASVL